MFAAVVIPAFNEAGTIAAVVKAAMASPWVVEVLVVDDGSEDETAAVAAEAGASVAVHPRNMGKAAAMHSGLTHTRQEVVLFLDGDLLGLRGEHVTSLVAPVATGDFPASIGVFHAGRGATDLAQVVAPFLSGQRALVRSLLADYFAEQPAAVVSRFGIEMDLTRWLKQRGVTVAHVPLVDLSHRMKEEKLGLVKGVAARARMYWEILRSVQRGAP